MKKVAEINIIVGWGGPNSYTQQKHFYEPSKKKKMAQRRQRIFSTCLASCEKVYFTAEIQIAGLCKKVSERSVKVVGHFDCC